jgi:excisionase family DNA binding protein
MRIYTTQEAAELTGSTVRALRKRIERGQLRAVQHGRYLAHPALRARACGPDRPGRGERGPGQTGNADTEPGAPDSRPTNRSRPAQRPLSPTRT